MRSVKMGAQEGNEARLAAPYLPSWVDRFTDWAGRRRYPSWVYSFAVGAIEFLIPTVVLWVEGALPVGRILPVQAYLAGVMAFFLAFIRYSDKSAADELAALRPNLEATDEEYQQLLYRLTTLPRGTTMIIGLGLVAIVLLSEVPSGPYRLEVLAPYPISAVLLRFMYLLNWWVFGTFLYHTIHQLGVINHIYTQHTRIDIFNRRPLYGFSNLAALTSGSVVLVLGGWLGMNPGTRFADPVTFLFVIGIALLAAATFIWPQLGIHRLQVMEKERLLAESYRQLRDISARVHQRIADGELKGLDELNTAMACLNSELQHLKEVSTWPWQPGTVRWLVTALVLPLGLWLIQYLLQRFLIG